MPVPLTQDSATTTSALGALNSRSVQQNILTVINVYWVRSKPQVVLDCKMSTEHLINLITVISSLPSNMKIIFSSEFESLKITPISFNLELLIFVTHNLAPNKCGPLVAEEAHSAKREKQTKQHHDTKGVVLTSKQYCKKHFHYHKGCSTACSITSLVLLYYHDHSTHRHTSKNSYALCLIA